MATTRDQIIYDILNVVRAGQVSNTEPISSEQIGFWIDNTRVKLIKQDLDKRRSINSDIIQTLCVDLEQTDATTCPCTVTGCNILRSKKDIPEAIELNYRNLIISIGPVLLTEPRFSFIDYHRAIYYNPNQFSKNIPAAFLYNKRIYIISNILQHSMLETLSVEMVLERPEEAGAFFCSGTPCYSNESKYPISSFMLEDLKMMIIQNNLKIEVTAASDRSGDLSHNIQPNTEKNLK